MATTLRQHLNSATVFVEDAEKWNRVAEDLVARAQLGELDYGTAANAAHVARGIAREAERKAAKVFAQAAVEHGYPDV